MPIAPVTSALTAVSEPLAPLGSRTIPTLERPGRSWPFPGVLLWQQNFAHLLEESPQASSPKTGRPFAAPPQKAVIQQAIQHLGRRQQ